MSSAVRRDARMMLPFVLHDAVAETGQRCGKFPLLEILAPAHSDSEAPFGQLAGTKLPLLALPRNQCRIDSLFA